MKRKVEPRGVEPSTSRVRYASQPSKSLRLLSFDLQIAANRCTRRNPDATHFPAVLGADPARRRIRLPTRRSPTTKYSRNHTMNSSKVMKLVKPGDNVGPR